jgi:hypothetical protein
MFYRRVVERLPIDEAEPVPKVFLYFFSVSYITASAFQKRLMHQGKPLD